MPLIVPNIQDLDPAFAVMARRYAVYDEIISKSAGGRNGVIAGCDVTAQGSPNMSVAVSSGTLKINGGSYAINGRNVTVPTADTVFDRWDIIWGGIEDDVILTEGTPAEAPVPPSPPFGTLIVLAAIYVPALTTAITTDHILDTGIDVDPILGESQWTTLHAPIDVPRSNSGTMTDDPILSFAAGNGDEYRIRGVVWWSLLATSPGNTLLKYGWTMPASPFYGYVLVEEWSINRNSPVSGNHLAIGATGLRIFHGDTVDSNGVLRTGIASPGTLFKINFDGLLHTNTLGTFALKWTGPHAADEAVRLAGSYLEYEQQ